MFHMELFSSSIASGAKTFAQLDYSTVDNVLLPLVNGMQVSVNLPNVHSLMPIGAHMCGVRMQSTSMLPFPYPTLTPVNRGSAFESPPRVWDFSQNPWPLKPTEEFDIFASQNEGSSETEYCFVNYCDGKPTPYPVALLQGPLAYASAQPGRFFTVHASSSVTLTAGAWSLCQPSFDQALPPGMYALVGASAFSATGLAFRMFPSQSPQWRPGGIMKQTYDALDPPNQRAWQQGYPTAMGWGVWLTFFQNVPPQVEIYATSADTAEEFWWDLIYISTAVTGGP